MNSDLKSEVIAKTNESSSAESQCGSTFTDVYSIYLVSMWVYSQFANRLYEEKSQPSFCHLHVSIIYSRLCYVAVALVCCNFYSLCYPTCHIVNEKTLFHKSGTQHLFYSLNTGEPFADWFYMPHKSCSAPLEHSEQYD